MERSVLITGKQSAFTDDLVQEVLQQASRVYASFDESDTPPEVPDTFGESLRYLPWNRRSLVSSRSLMLAVAAEVENGREGAGKETPPEGASGNLSHAIVVCTPEGLNASLHDTPAVTIEETIDAAVKGYLFVVREIAATFMRSGRGDLTVLWYDPGVDVLPPLDGTLAGAVDGLVRSLVAFYENEAVTIRGLSASDGDGRSVARWVVEQIFERGEKSAGRRQRYGQKMGILPFRR